MEAAWSERDSDTPRVKVALLLAEHENLKPNDSNYSIDPEVAAGLLQKLVETVTKKE